MFSRFFIDRPVFASVLSLLILIAGGVAIFALPIARYPEIVPPTIQITAVYPGADAQTVAESVAAPIEQELSGVRNLIYFNSQSANNGAARIVWRHCRRRTASRQVGRARRSLPLRTRGPLGIAKVFTDQVPAK